MYIVIPVDSPARIVDEHLHDNPKGVVSDALGGAWPISIMVVGRPLAIHLRDDCVTAGLGRNRLAGVLVGALSKLPTPLIGPVVLTAVVEVGDGGPGVTMGVNSCLPDGIAEEIKAMADGMWLALTGREAQIDPADTAPYSVDRWATSVRGIADSLDAEPLSPTYPYPPGVPRDRIAEGLARHNIHVARQPADTDLT
jgi:hypothetical protein